jgi:hypothetical protein
MATHSSTMALSVIFQVRDGKLNALLWKRAITPDAHKWALPGGSLLDNGDIEESIRLHLAVKVDLKQVIHLEQLGVWSDPNRFPGERQIAVAFLGLVPVDVDPQLPSDTVWHPLDKLPPMAFDHKEILLAGRERLRSKLSYTNIGFALAPTSFSISALQKIYEAALGHKVAPTNLQRVLVRREAIVPAGETKASSAGGGRPAQLYKFKSKKLQVTDKFAILRPKS